MTRHTRARWRPDSERLESRINLAATSVTYADVDGDLVRITATLPGAAAPPLDVADLQLTGGATGQLQRLTLADAGFTGAGIVFSVVKKPGGDGLADVGSINAANIDLGRVVVKGDLGQIVVGNRNDPAPALTLLKARSFGALGLTTGAASLTSQVFGSVGAVQIARDVVNATLISRDPDAGIGSVVIGRNLIGSEADGSGVIRSTGTIGSVRIGGSVIGGAGDGSGRISSASRLATVTIGGSIFGGAGTESGFIDSTGTMGAVRVGGSIVGGAGDYAGGIRSTGAIDSVWVGRSLAGGAGDFSGRVGSSGRIATTRFGGAVTGGTGLASGQCLGFELGTVAILGNLAGGGGDFSGTVSATGAIDAVRIGGSLIGGSVSGTASLTDSGQVATLGRIGSVVIAGSIISGSDTSTGTLERSGAIVAAELPLVTVGGGLVGNKSNPVRIVALGQVAPLEDKVDRAIGRVSVRGDVLFGAIMAGFDYAARFVPGNADASIGSIQVGGDWIASSAAAGVRDLGVLGFGLTDSLQVGGDASVAATIERVVIGGNVRGTVEANDEYGFVAEKVLAVRIAGLDVQLREGGRNDREPIRFTADVSITEPA